MKRHLIAISVLLLFFGWAEGQNYRVFPVHCTDSAVTQLHSGFFYNLPENYLVVSVTLHKISRYAGPFADYAEKLLGLSGAIRENDITYAIGSIEVEMKARTDTSKTYWVEFPRKDNPEQLPLQIYESQDFHWKHELPLYNERTRERFEMYDNYTLIEKIDTTYEAKEIDSSIVLIPKIHKKMVEKTTAQKADEAMEKIKNIRKAQWLLLTGDFEMDFSNLPYMISELKQEEESCLSLFSGFTVTEEETCIFVITLPQEKIEMAILPLFDFSERTGVAKKINGADVVSYQLQLANQHYTDIKSSVIRMQTDKKQKGSFYYRIPEYYTATLLKQKQVVKSLGQFPISQYGIENRLPENVKQLELDPLTGALKSVIFSK